MSHPFDPGYALEPFASLVADYPGEDVYPREAFRTEWGPIFHRGRLDGTARVLVIGQDPAQHEAIVRRSLVGEAGQRIQGFLAKLGVERSYVFINTFLYSVYGQGGGEKHIRNAEITKYRNRWIDAILQAGTIQAIVTLGHLADTAYKTWASTTTASHMYASVLHPTYPESASRARRAKITKAEAMKRLCANWNDALTALSGHLTVDAARPLVLYGEKLTLAELAPIPELDLPPGLPDWMRSLDAWARRTGASEGEKRSTIKITIPRSAAWWL